MRKAPTPKNHKEYIAREPKTVAVRLKQIDDIVFKSVPDAQEVISYGMPAFKYQGRILIYFAAHTNHIGIYPAPRSVPEFKDELAGYGGGKGTVQFPHAERFPIGLIGRIVKHKAKELSERMGTKKKPSRPAKSVKPERSARKRS